MKNTFLFLVICLFSTGCAGRSFWNPRSEGPRIIQTGPNGEIRVSRGRSVNGVAASVGVPPSRKARHESYSADFGGAKYTSSEYDFTYGVGTDSSGGEQYVTGGRVRIPAYGYEARYLRFWPNATLRNDPNNIVVPSVVQGTPFLGR